MAGTVCNTLSDCLTTAPRVLRVILSDTWLPRSGGSRCHVSSVPRVDSAVLVQYRDGDTLPMVGRT